MGHRVGNRTLVVLITGLRLVAAAPTWADDPEARDLVHRVLEAIPRQSFVAKLTVSNADSSPREVQMSRKYVGDTHGSYLEVTAPGDLAGIRFLFLERAHAPDEQYIKVKASRNAVRVSDDIRKQPFLGSAFYVSDLVMPDLDEYTYRVVGSDTVSGRSATLVEMTPKQSDREIYAKTILALDPRDLLVLRREFFDRKGDKVKVWTVDKIERIDGIWTLTGQEMQNLKENTRSRLDVRDIKYNAALPDEMFTPQYLVR